MIRWSARKEAEDQDDDEELHECDAVSVPPLNLPGSADRRVCRGGRMFDRLHETRILVPRSEEQQPSRDRLAVRFEQFLRGSKAS